MLGHDVVAAVPDLRLQAESMMRDTALVSADGVPTFDPNTGLMSSTPTVIYEGPARLRMPTATESSVLFGGEDVTMTRFILSVPHDVTGIGLENIVTMITSDDPSALDRTFRVVTVPSRSFPIERSFGLETVE